MTLLELLLNHPETWPEGADHCYQRGKDLYFRRESDTSIVSIRYSNYAAEPNGPEYYVTVEEYNKAKGVGVSDYGYAWDLLSKLQEHLIATLPEGTETSAFQKLEELKEDMDWLYNVEPVTAEMRKHLDLEDYSYTEESMIFNVLKELAKAGFRKQEK